MDIPARQLIHGLIFIMGLVLIIGGIATGTEGAWIIGLIVAAVNYQQWQKWDEHRTLTDKKKPNA